MQINLTGFLQSKNAMEFMAELWDLLISAQNSPTGIPEHLMDLKREELAKKKVKHDPSLVLSLFYYKGSKYSN